MSLPSPPPAFVSSSPPQQLFSAPLSYAAPPAFCVSPPPVSQPEAWPYAPARESETRAQLH